MIYVKESEFTLRANRHKSYLYFASGENDVKWFFINKRPGPIRRFFFWLLLGAKWRNI